MATPTNSSSAFPPPRHKRNNSTGSLPSIGMCSFGSFNFDGHDSVFRAGSGGGGGDGDDSIVSEFERMFGGGSSSNDKSSSNVTGSTGGMTASTMAHLPMILPSPKPGENSGPLRRRLHAVDTLNLPPCTPGSTAAASNRSRYSASATTTASKARSSSGSSSSKASTPSTPSQIGEIIFGGGGMGAASPAPSQVTLSTIGTNGTPVSRSTMRDLLDTLNSLEGGGDDVSSFGGSIGQSTITSKFQSPAAAPRSSSAKSLHTVTSSSSSSSAASSRPPRALNIPSRNISSAQRDSSVGAPPSGIPRPVSASTTNAGSMPPIHQKRETRAHHTFGAGDVSGPRRVSRNKNGTTSKSTSKVSSTKGFQIPTIAQEVEADTQVATRAPPQSAICDSDRKENANAAVHVSKLPPMKGRSRPKAQGKQKQSGAFPTSFGSTMALNTNENVVMPMKASAKSRVKSTKNYTTTRGRNNQQTSQKLPSLHSLPPTNQRQYPDAVLPGSRRNYVGGNAHNVGTLAEF